MDHDLFKVPDDVIINLLKKEIAGLRINDKVKMRCT